MKLKFQIIQAGPERNKMATKPMKFETRAISVAQLFSGAEHDYSKSYHGRKEGNVFI